MEERNSSNAVRVLIGLLFIAAGVIWALISLDLLTIDFSLKGWWTVFIIAPSIFGLFTDRQKAGPVFGLGMGILLLLAARDIISWQIMGKLFLALMLVVIGVACIFKKDIKAVAKIAMDKGDVKTIHCTTQTIKKANVSFGKLFLDCDGERFEGSEVKASFGAVRLDLRKAVVSGKALIHLDCNFCGVEILVPEGVGVRTIANSSFGEIKDERGVVNESQENVILLEGNVSFGAVEIM